MARAQGGVPEHVAPGVPNRAGLATHCDKVRGRETHGGETREEVISGRPTPGRRPSNVSKTVSRVLEIRPGLYKENGGQKGGGACRQAAKVKSVLVWESVRGGVFLAQAVPVV